MPGSRNFGKRFTPLESFLHTAVRLGWQNEALRIALPRLGAMEREIVQDFVGELLADVAKKIPAALESDEDRGRYFFASLRNRLNSVERGRPKAIRCLAACAECQLTGVDVADSQTVDAPDAGLLADKVFDMAAGKFPAAHLAIVTAHLRDGQELKGLAATGGIAYHRACKWVAKFKAWAQDQFGKDYEAYKQAGSE